MAPSFREAPTTAAKCLVCEPIASLQDAVRPGVLFHGMSCRSGAVASVFHKHCNLHWNTGWCDKNAISSCSGSVAVHDEVAVQESFLRSTESSFYPAPPVSMTERLLAG
ncbi:hypothetical protein RSSM_03394 [Rhodopirellula sallentina SM41]|uniref:Uncharacterized protein n=1 Tax=Rhodopirellula sallentina SM41 TaxID=1263870 RepID=M5U144_9BACT|nr:hypothetical protein RSSM_03394 [Rhodopirellula sallentina SM41]